MMGVHPPHAVGDSVILQGLKARPELNGGVGTVTGVLLPNGRVPVVVHNEKLAVKPENLRSSQRFADSLPAEQAQCAAPAPSTPELIVDAVLEPLADVAVDSRAATVIASPSVLEHLPTAPIWSPPALEGAPAWRPVADLAAVDQEEDEELDEEADEQATLASDAALLESAVRGAPAGGGGFQQVSASAWRDDSVSTPSDGRWRASLCGGAVRECDVRTAEGLAAARRAVDLRVPIVLRGGASVLLGSAHSQLGGVKAVDETLRGSEVTVLYAPPDVDRRFTYYFDELA